MICEMHVLSEKLQIIAVTSISQTAVHCIG